MIKEKKTITGATYTVTDNVMFTSHLVETRKGPVEYWLAGKESDSRPVVMASHGGLGGVDQARLMLDWVDQEKYRLLCLSRPGFLLTPLESGKHFEDQADLFAELLDTLGIKQIGLVAASAGGPAALTFAKRHPDRLWGLLTIDCVSGQYAVPDTTSPIAIFLITSQLGQAIFQKFIRMFPAWAAREIIKPGAYYTKEGLYKHVDQVLKDPTARNYLNGLFNSMKHFGLRMAGTNNDLNIFRQIDNIEVGAIRIPTLVIHGTHDADVNFLQGVYLYEHIPGASQYWIQEGGHLGFWLDKEASKAQEAARGFLDQWSR